MSLSRQSVVLVIALVLTTIFGTNNRKYAQKSAFNHKTYKLVHVRKTMLKTRPKPKPVALVHPVRTAHMYVLMTVYN